MYFSTKMAKKECEKSVAYSFVMWITLLMNVEKIVNVEKWSF